MPALPAAIAQVSMGVGICYCHTPAIPMIGLVLTGSQNTKVNNCPLARIGDLVLGYCGHIGVIISGASFTKTNASPVARKSDYFVGCFTGFILTGSHNTFIG